MQPVPGQWDGGGLCQDQPQNSALLPTESGLICGERECNSSSFFFFLILTPNPNSSPCSHCVTSYASPFPQLGGQSLNLLEQKGFLISITCRNQNYVFTTFSAFLTYLLHVCL